MGAAVALALAGCEEQASDPMSGLDPKSARDPWRRRTSRSPTSKGVARSCLTPGDASRPPSDFSQAQRIEI